METENTTARIFFKLSERNTRPMTTAVGNVESSQRNNEKAMASYDTPQEVTMIRYSRYPLLGLITDV